MSKVAEVMELFDAAVGASCQDSLHRIVREFALAQTRYGHEMAIQALAMCLIVAETRRRCMETDLMRLQRSGH